MFGLNLPHPRGDAAQQLLLVEDLDVIHKAAVVGPRR
jgi:hypothetical protein